MALRSVVLEPPTPPGAPRKTVVLRPGGPQPKGRAIDIAACILGVLLLIGAIVLVQALPNKDYVNPRYKLSFPAGGGEFAGSASFDFVESSANTHDFLIEIPQDNVVSLNIRVGFEDNLRTSKPDLFRIRVYDNNGNELGLAENLANPAPTENISSEPPYHSFDVFRAQATYTFAIGALPQESIVQGIDRKETQAEVLARLEPATHTATKGTWKVSVELLDAGDCPLPTDPDPDPAQMTDCLQSQGQSGNPAETSSTDAGNDFTLENVSWTYFLTCTETMELRDPKPLPSCK